MTLKTQPLWAARIGSRHHSRGMQTSSYRLTQLNDRSFRVEITERSALAHAVSGLPTVAEARAWIARDRWRQNCGQSWQRFAARYGGSR
jgi:hypothetical protein